jgi:hypothetical protein
MSRKDFLSALGVEKKVAILLVERVYLLIRERREISIREVSTCLEWWRLKRFFRERSASEC